MTMVRKQVYITREQDEELKSLAAQYGVTEAEIMRRGIVAMKRDSEAARARRMEAWHRIEEIMDRHVATRPPGSGIQKFRREEAYDDDRHTKLLS
jgi:hypothetical protein